LFGSVGYGDIPRSKGGQNIVEAGQELRAISGAGACRCVTFARLSWLLDDSRQRSGVMLARAQDRCGLKAMPVKARLSTA